MCTPTKITTARRPGGDPSLITVLRGKQALGVLKRTSEGWYLTMTICRGPIVKYEAYGSPFPSKRAAVEHLIKMVGDPIWMYYGGTWLAHCAKLQAEKEKEQQAKKSEPADLGWTNRRFVDVKLAIGHLVLSGLEVYVTREGAGLQLHSGEQCIATCIRDGSGWVVKAETVQDFVDQFQMTQGAQ